MTVAADERPWGIFCKSARDPGAKGLRDMIKLAHLSLKRRETRASKWKCGKSL